MSDTNITRPTFEESIDLINNELNKRRRRWTLTAVADLDFEDVCQIIRLHIWKKWHLYDHNKPLVKWLNTVISNQTINIVRNNYTNFSKPCNKCEHAHDNDLCNLYDKQCNDCSLYARWEKTKKRAHDVKLPVTIENHKQEVYDMPYNSIDIDASSKRLHDLMLANLNPFENEVYKLAFIEHKTDEEIVIIMKLVEKNRSSAERNAFKIKVLRDKFLKKAKVFVFGGEIDIV